MAIPFKIPNQQPMSEQQIRELYDLLQHLMIVCQQQILAAEAVRNRASVTTSPPATTVSYERRVLSTLSAALQGNQQVRRQRLKRSDSGCQKPNEAAPLPLLTFEGELWIRVGSDLRKIADEFDVTLEQRSEAIHIGGGDEVDSPLPRRSEACPSRCSILFKLLPRPSFIMGSICTAVIFVGWHLLQNR